MPQDNESRENTTARSDDVTRTTLSSHGFVKEQDIQMLGDDLFRLVDELGRRKILLNCQKIEFVSGAALGKLLTLHRKLQAVQGKLVIVGLAPDIRDVFRINKLDKILTFVETEAEANAIFAAMSAATSAATPLEGVLSVDDIRQIESDGLTLGDAIRKLESCAE